MDSASSHESCSIRNYSLNHQNKKSICSCRETVEKNCNFCRENESSEEKNIFVNTRNETEKFLDIVHDQELSDEIYSIIEDQEFSCNFKETQNYAQDNAIGNVFSFCESTNGFRFAAVVASSLRDLRLNNGGKRVILLQLYAKDGKLGLYILQYLKKSGFTSSDFLFVMSDRDSSKVDQIRLASSLKPFVDSECLDFANVDLEKFQVSFKTLHHGITIYPGSFSMVVLVYESFFAQTNDDFFVLEQGKLYQMERVIDQKLEKQTKENLMVPCGEKHYDQIVLDMILQFYKTYLKDDSRFVIPVTLLQVLNHCMYLSGDQQQLLFLSSQEGYGTLEEVAKYGEKAHQQQYQQLQHQQQHYFESSSSPVNMHSLELFRKFKNSFSVALLQKHLKEQFQQLKISEFQEKGKVSKTLEDQPSYVPLPNLSTLEVKKFLEESRKHHFKDNHLNVYLVYNNNKYLNAKKREFFHDHNDAYKEKQKQDDLDHLLPPPISMFILSYGNKGKFSCLSTLVASLCSMDNLGSRELGCILSGCLRFSKSYRFNVPQMSHLWTTKIRSSDHLKWVILPCVQERRSHLNSTLFPKPLTSRIQRNGFLRTGNLPISLFLCLMRLFCSEPLVLKGLSEITSRFTFASRGQLQDISSEIRKVEKQQWIDVSESNDCLVLAAQIAYFAGDYETAVRLCQKTCHFYGWKGSVLRTWSLALNALEPIQKNKVLVLLKTASSFAPELASFQRPFLLGMQESTHPIQQLPIPNQDRETLLNNKQKDCSNMEKNNKQRDCSNMEINNKQEDCSNMEINNKQKDCSWIEMEKNVLLRDSVMWRLMKQFYDTVGIDAWSRKSDDVPSFVTTNCFMASSYAKMVLSFITDRMLDMNQSGRLGSSLFNSVYPLYIVELGSGTGKLGYLFMQEFEKLVKQMQESLKQSCPRCQFTTSNPRDHSNFSIPNVRKYPNDPKENMESQKEWEKEKSKDEEIHEFSSASSSPPPPPLPHHQCYFDPEICYVLTDFTWSNVKSWKENKKLKPYLDSGKMDFAIFDAEIDESFFLLQSKRTLSKESLGNLVVVANYLLDSLTCDAFRMEEGILKEGRISTWAPTPLSSPSSPLHVSPSPLETKEVSVNLEHCRSTFEFIPVPNNNPNPKTSTTSNNNNSKMYYDKPIWDAILDEYRTVFQSVNQTFLFPSGAFRCLENLSNLVYKKDSIHGSFLFLCTDKGETSLEDILEETKCDPYLDTHGSFSVAVNFHALSRLMDHLGGSSYLPEVRCCHVNSCVFTLPSRSEKHSLQYHAFTQMNQFSPDSFFTLWYALCSRGSANLGFYECLSVIALSHFDPDVFWQYRNELRVGILHGGYPSHRHQSLLSILPLVYQRTFDMPGADDILLYIARLSLLCHAEEFALTVIKECFSIFHNLGMTDLEDGDWNEDVDDELLARCNSQALAFYLEGLCHEKKANYTMATSCFAECLQKFPGFPNAQHKLDIIQTTYLTNLTNST